MNVPSGKLGTGWDVAYGVLYLALRRIPIRECDRTRHRRRTDRLGHRKGVGMMADHRVHRLRRDGRADRRTADRRRLHGAPVRSARRGDGAAGRARRRGGEFAARGRDRRRNRVRVPALARGEPRGRVRRGWRDAAGLRAYVEMSTIGSAPSRRSRPNLPRATSPCSTAPVSGGPRGARAGTLSTMVAGEHATFERVQPMFEALARNVFYVGDEPGLGQVTKLANNMISAAGMAAAFEARRWR